MLQNLWEWLLSRVFGEGMASGVAVRGTEFLGKEISQAVHREDQEVTRVRLRAGESYTVVARPPATRRERKLAKSERSLNRKFEALNRPTKSQLRSARRLSRAQRRMGPATPLSKRGRKRAQKEAALGRRFDQKMRPSKQQLKVARELTATKNQLDASRAVSLQLARRKNRIRRRRTKVTVYD
ncbi:hypothetical protein IMCC26207_110354 [Actinobacteria bacterium IMCC26207]|nr:hypothetical protein IMCC26207_110354 [Actinobacteria bacterium IMCC26207]